MGLTDSMRKYPAVHFRLAALVIAVALFGCGGGGGGGSGGGSGIGSNSTSSCLSGQVKVALLGDSTMVGLDGGNPPTTAPNNPGVVLQRTMDTNFGVGAVLVTNYGVSGSVAGQAPRVSADVVVANFGINDMRQFNDIQTFTRNMAATGATLFETQNPIVDRSWPESSFVQAVKGLGKPVADTNAYVLSLPNWQALVADGVHPNDALYQLIVEKSLGPAVSLQVAALRCK